MALPRSHRRLFLPLLAGLLAWFSVERIVAAHSITIFAYVEGEAIRGEVFALGAGPIAGATITAFAPDGEKLAETTADERGEFSILPTRRCDWRLVAAADAAHHAETTVRSDELPPALSGEVRSSGPAAAADPTSSEADLAELNRQVIALRRDLEQFRRELRWQDLIGGVGYILGLMGLTYYYLGVRRRTEKPPADA